MMELTVKISGSYDSLGTDFIVSLAESLSAVLEGNFRRVLVQYTAVKEQVRTRGDYAEGTEGCSVTLLFRFTPTVSTAAKIHAALEDLFSRREIPLLDIKDNKDIVK